MRLKTLTATLLGLVALALPVAGHANPQPWETNLQPAFSPIMERIHSFHSLLLWVISLIVLLVLALLVYVCFRFREDKNPVPSRRSHHTLLEIVWTAVPVLILVTIAIPSFKLLYYMDVVPKTEMTLKAIGHQWYWSYQYPDNGNFTFDAYMLSDDDRQPDQPRLLATDNAIVLPVGTNIKVQTFGEDVIHSWAMPALGIKVDAIPGHLNEGWIHINEPGMYYGQCSELCGVNHGFMPIMIKAVPKDEFDAWVKDAQTKFAKVDAPVTRVADARPAAPAAN
ncbi:MAG: cytochrome c oxidase subunit II [Geminicoccaceae bacterium]